MSNDDRTAPQRYRPADRPNLTRRSVLRSSVFGGLAAAWWIAAAFDALELPNSAVVLVIGLVASLSLEPDHRFPHRGVTVST